MVKNLPAMWETWVQSLGWGNSLEKGMATHSSILVWRLPWREEPGGAPISLVSVRGLPWWLRQWRICLQCRFSLWVGKIPCRKQWLSTPVLFLPREFHEQRSLAGYSPLGRKVSDMTGQLIFSHFCINTMFSQSIPSINLSQIFGLMLIHQSSRIWRSCIIPLHQQCINWVEFVSVKYKRISLKWVVLSEPRTAVHLHFFTFHLLSPHLQNKTLCNFGRYWPQVFLICVFQIEFDDFDKTSNLSL